MRVCFVSTRRTDVVCGWTRLVGGVARVGRHVSQVDARGAAQRVIHDGGGAAAAPLVLVAVRVQRARDGEPPRSARVALLAAASFASRRNSDYSGRWKRIQIKETSPYQQNSGRKTRFVL